jgi:hypothetical protein
LVAGDDCPNELAIELSHAVQGDVRREGPGEIINLAQDTGTAYEHGDLSREIGAADGIE